MRIVIIGCVDFSAAMLGMLLDHPEAEIVGLVTRNESSANADFHDLQPFARQAGCPVFLSTGKDQQTMAAWLRERQADVIYCLGWSLLLTAEVLAIPPLGVVGYHPAALPQNRGRHPIIWALALGLEQTASSFFLMDEGADSGDILSQTPVDIEPTKPKMGPLLREALNRSSSSEMSVLSSIRMACSDHLCHRLLQGG